MNKKHIIQLHVIFWSVTLFTIGLESIPAIGKTPSKTILLDNLIYAVSFISLFYLYYLFISVKHFSKRNIVYLILSGLLFILLFTIPVTAIYIYFLQRAVFDLTGKEFFLEFRTYYFGILETNFLFAAAGSLLKTALLWYDNVMKQKEMEKQLISNELTLLRSQINPQFLFNSLTNIKSLINSEPEKAVHSIENLSEIMSYLLYDSSEDKVLLDKEIININNYLNLQRVKYNHGFIDFKITGNTAGIFIPPLIFMPFIENAFKYENGFSKTPGIIINLDVGIDYLLFEVINRINENTNQQKPNDGFDIKSIKRRLNLLYRDNYILEIRSENNQNIIKLKINCFSYDLFEHMVN